MLATDSKNCESTILARILTLQGRPEQGPGIFGVSVIQQVCFSGKI